MSIEEKVKNTPLNERPLINDTPGQPAHHMTVQQYTAYLQKQEEMANMPIPAPDPLTALTGRVSDLEYLITGKEVTHAQS